MATETKIHLSKLEMELVKNKEWILTKHSIINKVYELFGKMHIVYKGIAENEGNVLLELGENSSGKISKGENYLGLPYVILDYPAVFSKEKIFAIRTMFWWGNFFSISLHLSGKNFQIQRNTSAVKTFLKENEFFLCVNENEWQHHFELSNYIVVEQLGDEEFLEIIKKNFFKISKKIELDKWKEIPKFFEKTFLEIIEFIKISCLTDERVL